ncbi:hypothetical protein HAX54_030902, partial [Datura stramonium]|nr:hypothetical protein [Datura stramonium]
TCLGEARGEVPEPITRVVDRDRGQKLEEVVKAEDEEKNQIEAGPKLLVRIGDRSESAPPRLWCWNLLSGLVGIRVPLASMA